MLGHAEAPGTQEYMLVWFVDPTKGTLKPAKKSSIPLNDPSRILVSKNQRKPQPGGAMENAGIVRM